MFWQITDESEDEADVNVIGANVADVKANLTYISKTVVVWSNTFPIFFLVCQKSR